MAFALSRGKAILPLTQSRIKTPAMADAAGNLKGGSSL